MGKFEDVVREIQEMDRAIEDYFRKDRAGEDPRRPDYKAFINSVRVRYGKSIESPIKADRDVSNAVLDKLLTYERVWNGQFMRYAEECERERERQTFLHRANGAIRQIARKTGVKVDEAIIDYLGTQYDEIVRGGAKPSVFYNKATGAFSVRAKVNR